ncbi:MAG: TPM domain-containing protein [Candidatus Peribacteraceae bacterium]|nr:TPM domain-containing protein [Candidatus Peribacteraceae bacterium]
MTIAVALALLPVSGFAFPVPPNDGFVTDTAGILAEADRAAIAERLQAYRAQTSNEIAVLIVQSLNGEPIADVAVEVGRAWGVGTKENNNGILLLIAYEDRQMFLATGYGLEGAVPDIVAKGIIDQEMAPRFREGDYAGGIRAAIDALEKHIGGEYTAERYAQSASGALPFGFFIFFGIILLQVLTAFLGRSKSWWLGGVIGAVVGFVLALIFTWWWSVPLLVLIGLFIDFIASKTYKPGKRRRGGGFWMGGGGMGSGSSGGGFGGFSGGSFGGGGAGGRW